MVSGLCSTTRIKRDMIGFQFDQVADPAFIFHILGKCRLTDRFNGGDAFAAQRV